MKTLSGFITVLATLAVTATAAEPRTWVVADGRSFEGELQKVQGNSVTILMTKEGKPVQLDKTYLSIGDNDYIKEFAPDAKAGFSVTQAIALPVPAKMAKVDRKLFKDKAGTLTIPAATFDILETPHFKVMYTKGVDAADVGELAERMWVDAAFFHATFAAKFRTEKMGIFVAPDDSTYDRIGMWYAELLEKSGNLEAANHVKGTWARGAAGSMRLPVENARDNGLMQHARVFRGYRRYSDGKRTEPIKGVWVPFYTHCLAGDMLDIQAGGVTGFGKKGWFAVDAGHSYSKEIGLTGKSETNLISARSMTGNDASTSGGFKDVRNWASELKKLVRKGEVPATFDKIYGIEANGADEKDIALVYGFARYLESSLPKLSSFSKLIQRVSTSSQMPDPESLAKIYGFESAAAMEADLQKYLTGPEFR